jgi:F420-dependent oxidoreductase-like protein
MSVSTAAETGSEPVGSMKFGLFIPQGWRHDLVGIDPAEQWTVLLGVARAADAGPWESVWVYDHFHTIPIPSEEPTHEAWTLMSALAASTDRIRLGQMCTCMGYRNPAYLAKVAATVDHVSGGRLDVGIGGGWYEHEWRAYGYGFPPVGERLARLREGVEIMHQAWTTGTATLDGKYFTAQGAIVRPLPRQEGGIPLWVAGGGEKKTLRIAAQYASYTNFFGDAETFAHKSEVLRGHCADLGTDFDAITRSVEFHTIIGSTEAEVAKRRRAVAARLRTVLSEQQTGNALSAFDGPQAMVGTPEQVIERLTDFTRQGMGYALHYFPEAAYDRSGIELFEREVMPALS